MEKYITINNGGFGFEVVLDPAKIATVFALNKDKETGSFMFFDEFVTRFEYKRVFLVMSRGGDTLEESQDIYGSDHIGDLPETIGNTILFELSNGKFVFVGSDSVYEFRLEKGDSVKEFYSPIGPSDCPYPSILGEHNWYSLAEMRKVPLDLFGDFKHCQWSL